MIKIIKWNVNIKNIRLSISLKSQSLIIWIRINNDDNDDKKMMTNKLLIKL